MQSSTQHSTPFAAPPIDETGGIGQRLVVGLVVLGLGLAGFAIWFQWQQTRRCLAFYGSDSARWIQAATRVELWEPQDGALSGLESAKRVDISHAPGLVHLRRGLVEDANFDWQRADGSEAAWDAAFAFYGTADAATPATVLVVDFDPAGGTLRVVGRDGRVGLGRLEKGLRSWLEGVRAKK